MQRCLIWALWYRCQRIFQFSSCFEPIDVITLRTPWWPQLHSTYHWPQVSSIYFMRFLCFEHKLIFWFLIVMCWHCLPFMQCSLAANTKARWSLGPTSKLTLEFAFFAFNQAPDILSRARKVSSLFLGRNIAWDWYGNFPAIQGFNFFPKIRCLSEIKQIFNSKPLCITCFVIFLPGQI